VQTRSWGSLPFINPNQLAKAKRTLYHAKNCSARVTLGRTFISEDQSPYTDSMRQRTTWLRTAQGFALGTTVLRGGDKDRYQSLRWCLGACIDSRLNTDLELLSGRFTQEIFCSWACAFSFATCPFYVVSTFGSSSSLSPSSTCSSFPSSTPKTPHSQSSHTPLPPS
jgi:hypothetical protein